MLYQLDIYRRLLGVQLRSQMQYRTSFWLSLTGTGLVTFLEFAALGLTFQRFGTIQGWTLAEVAFLYGMVELGFGIMDMVFGGFDPGFFGQEVRLGTFDRLLLRPLNLNLQVMSLDFALRRIGKIIIGVAILGFGVTNASIDWTLLKVLYIPVILAGIVLFFGGLYLIGAGITFWTIDSIEAINIVTYGGSYTISHPMHIYPSWLRQFFTFIVPAIFLNYYPALYVLGKSDPFGVPILFQFAAPAVGLMAFILANQFWKFGVRHYRSTGS
jgi:ABC-2 type transport system permease protein